MTNPKLKQAIERHDVDSARIEIRAIADDDIDRDTPIAVVCADEAHSAFASQGQALYEDDDGWLIMPPRSEWSRDLLYKIKGSLDWNFSRERLVHLQEVTVWLRDKEKNPSGSFRHERANRPQTSPRSVPGSNTWVKYAVVGLAAALALGVVAFRLWARNR